MNGIRWYVVGVLSLLLAVAPRLRAEEPTPGDVGTPECVYLQNTVHDDLQMESEQWRNHGALMKRVEEIVSPELEAGNITEECSSCITNQYARDIDPDLQEPCGPPENPDERFARIADRVPGFGGMFHDEEQDTMVIYLVDPAQRDAAVQALQASFGPERVPADRVQVVQGDYDFRQLKTWKDRLTPLWNNSAVLSTDVDEATNRLVVGIDESSGQLIDTSQLEIPAEALVLKGTQPAEAFQTLESTERPLVGGLAMLVRRDDGWAGVCSLGFLARRGGALGLVTNSHCTGPRTEMPAPIGRVDGVVFDQPNYYPPNPPRDRVAIETVDPPKFPGGRFPCPGAYDCRYSDSVFARLTLYYGTSFLLRFVRYLYDPGYIARVSGASRPYNIVGRYRIVGVHWTLTGERVHKVGFRTGHTSGLVTNTCVDSYWAGVQWICQNYADLPGGEGDSGSPVFFILNRPQTYDVALAGLLAGGAFSPILNVLYELGVLSGSSIPTVCAYPFTC